VNILRNPSLPTYRTAFFFLFLAGFALCSLDGVGQAPTYGWTHPITIVGAVLGLFALLLGVTVLLRRYPPPLSGDRAAFFALLGIIALKLVLAALYPLFG
jgi:hypothetical protein